MGLRAVNTLFILGWSLMLFCSIMMVAGIIFYVFKCMKKGGRYRWCGAIMYRIGQVWALLPDPVRVCLHTAGSWVVMLCYPFTWAYKQCRTLSPFGCCKKEKVPPEDAPADTGKSHDDIDYNIETDDAADADLVDIEPVNILQNTINCGSIALHFIATAWSLIPAECSAVY